MIPIPSGANIHIDLGKPTIVFLTVCTKDRKPWLVCGARPAMDRRPLCPMPDHAHFFCAPHDLDFPSHAWVRFWKGQFTRRTVHAEWRWQSHHWDTRLRRGENYSEKWEYVRQNPVRAGLVGPTKAK
jgi:putative transposase